VKAIVMTDRPYVILSCAMSLDGCIDDVSDERLPLSNEADFDRVDELRASCDAILVAKSWCIALAAPSSACRPGFGDRATVVGAGEEAVDFAAMLHDLAGRGIQRLMVEGGSTVLTQGLVDELHLAIAPFFVLRRPARGTALRQLWCVSARCAASDDPSRGASDR
jgi:5-amino-6-(5-phosphoribosylamino)uracil reductase